MVYSDQYEESVCSVEDNKSLEVSDGCCRELRKQDRIRLHVQFFVSLLLVNVVSIIWYSLIHYELLSNPVGTDSVISRNPVRHMRALHQYKPHTDLPHPLVIFCNSAAK